MRKDIKQQAAEMLELAGFRNVREYEMNMQWTSYSRNGYCKNGRDPKLLY